MDGLSVDLIQKLQPLLLVIPRILLAVLIVFVGRWLAKKTSRGLRNGFSKTSRVPVALARFFSSLVEFLVFFIALMVALSIVGIDTGAINGVVVGLAVAMAFSLKDALSDFAAGVMLIVFRPYRIGDEVEIDGVKGVVMSIDLTQTHMKTRANIELIVQNSAAWGGVIRNHSALGQRRLDMVFGVSYDADIDKAISVIIGAAVSDPRVFQNPKPWAKIVKLGDSSVDIELRMWCDYDDLRKIKMDISQPIKAALDAANIEIPYPHVVKIRQKISRSKARDRIAKLNRLRNT